MHRLSLLDAEFLHLEDESSPMHIAACSVFEGPMPTDAEIAHLFQSKLHLVPRYRQHVRVPPLELGRPVWVDDPHFDLARHVHRTVLPQPAGDAELCALMGRLMSHMLDRSMPLWEAWFVEGLDGGRWAMILKTHHCMVDGISGVDLLSVLLEPRRDTPLPEPVPWAPSSEPSRSAMVRDAWAGLARDASGWAGKLREEARHPSEAVRSVVETTAGLVAFVRRLRSTPPLSIEGSVGPRRVYAHAVIGIDDIRLIRKAFGGTLNDVVLALLGAAYRTLLLNRGEDLARAKVRSLVPVSVRAPDARGVMGNRVSAILCDLPVHLADPRERLRVVRGEMEQLKATHMAEAGQWLTEIGNLAPPMIVGGVSRLVARLLHQLPQHSVNTVTTNVPGPARPLYCLGREMLESFPYVPITQGVRIGTAILSYNGRVAFGVTGDRDSAPDVGVLAAAIAPAARELCDAAMKEAAQATPN